MARLPVYELAIGGTLCLYLEAIEGDPAIITPIAAKLKPVADQSAPIPAETLAAVGEATIAAQTASPGTNIDGTAIQPGFAVTIGAAVSATLSPGFYVMDMAFAVDGQPFSTTPVLIRAVNSVSLGGGA